MAKPKVFLCWSGGLSNFVAKQFHYWLKKNMGELVRPWFSEEETEPGEPWYPRIVKELEKTRRGLIFVTREMADAPWVLFEAGALRKEVAGSRVVPILVDITTSELPEPLKALQAVPFQKRKVFRALTILNRTLERDRGKLANVRRAFDTWWPSLTKQVRQYRHTTLHGAGNWGLVSSMQVAGAVSESPFQATDAFRIAEKRIAFVGQNLHYLIRGTRGNRKGHWREVREFLEKSNKRRIDILVIDPQADDAVAGWSTLFGRDFPRHLKNCERTLKLWRRYAQRAHISPRLRIILARFIPASITFVDPTLDIAKMFFTMPIIRESKPGDRPAFLITKRDNPEAFQYYWKAYNDVSTTPRTAAPDDTPLTREI